MSAVMDVVLAGGDAQGVSAGSRLDGGYGGYVGGHVYVASGMCVAGSVCHQWVCHELSHQR
jgi:hypothetical protein